MDIPSNQANKNLDIKLETPLGKCPTNRKVVDNPSMPKALMPYLSKLAQTRYVAIHALGSFAILTLYGSASSTSSWNTRLFFRTGCKKSKIFEKNDDIQNHLYKVDTIYRTNGNIFIKK